MNTGAEYGQKIHRLRSGLLSRKLCVLSALVSIGNVLIFSEWAGKQALEPAWNFHSNLDLEVPNGPPTHGGRMLFGVRKVAPLSIE